MCDYEVGHWITSYHREGRWVHDVSGILPIFAAGGKIRVNGADNVIDFDDTIGDQYGCMAQIADGTVR